MMAVAFISFASLLGAIAWHMIDVRFVTVRVSVAAFLPTLPDSNAPRYQFRLTRLFTSIRFWMRMALIACLLIALWPNLRPLGERQDQRLGVLIAVDLSDSMRTQNADGVSRLAEARAAVQTVLLEARARDEAFCSQIVGLYPQARPLTVAQLDAAVAGPGTVLPQALRLVGQADVTGPCRASHAVIVTDLAPLAMPESALERPEIWFQVGPSAENAAIVAARFQTALLGGAAAGVELRVSDLPATSVITVEGPSGGVSVSRAPDIADPSVELVRFEAAEAGEYSVALSGSGMAADAYDGDNTARFVVPSVSVVPVNWQVSQIPVPPSLVQDTADAAIYVGPLAGDPVTGPAVLVAPSSAGNSELIGFFLERDPMLAGLNLDAFERISLPTMPLPDGFVPVLAAQNSEVWIARRLDPPAILVPPMTLTTGEDARNTSILLLFNALREFAELPQADLPLSWRAPDDTVVRFANLEGNSDRALSASPDFEMLAEGRSIPEPAPLFPWLVVAALAVLLVERLYSMNWSRDSAGSRGESP